MTHFSDIANWIAKGKGKHCFSWRNWKWHSTCRYEHPYFCHQFCVIISEISHFILIWSKTLKLPFANPKMTKDLSPAMSTSKLFPLPVTTVTSPSLHTSYLVYNLLCYELWNFLFLTACMKCEVYLERFFQILKL